jgi:hypothetical protein
MGKLTLAAKGSKSTKGIVSGRASISNWAVPKEPAAMVEEHENSAPRRRAAPRRPPFSLPEYFPTPIGDKTADPSISLSPTVAVDTTRPARNPLSLSPLIVNQSLCAVRLTVAALALLSSLLKCDTTADSVTFLLITLLAAPSHDQATAKKQLAKVEY